MFDFSKSGRGGAQNKRDLKTHLNIQMFLLLYGVRHPWVRVRSISDHPSVRKSLSTFCVSCMSSFCVGSCCLLVECCCVGLVWAVFDAHCVRMCVLIWIALCCSGVCLISVLFSFSPMPSPRRTHGTHPRPHPASLCNSPKYVALTCMWHCLLECYMFVFWMYHAT